MQYQTDQELQTTRTNAIKTATYHGYPDLADDFAQFACMRQNSKSPSTMKRLLIDFLRSHYGRKGKNGIYTPKNLGRKNQTEFNPETHAQTTISTVPGTLDFLTYLEDLDPTHRAMMILKHKWDMTLGEIGEVFGFSEGRACQVIKAVEHVLHKRVVGQVFNETSKVPQTQVQVNN